jgi:hypothetical protein
MNPMTDKTPAELADTAADAIRALAHATINGRPGLEYPGDVYSTVANIKEMTSSLPQICDQLWTFLSGLAGDAHLRSVEDTLDADLSAVRSGLADAGTAARALYEALNRAHSGLGPLAYED